MGVWHKLREYRTKDKRMDNKMQTKTFNKENLNTEASNKRKRNKYFPFLNSTAFYNNLGISRFPTKNIHDLIFICRVIIHCSKVT